MARRVDNPRSGAWIGRSEAEKGRGVVLACRKVEDLPEAGRTSIQHGRCDDGLGRLSRDRGDAQ